jgi:uncharacterized membrane protein YhhN
MRSSLRSVFTAISMTAATLVAGPSDMLRIVGFILFLVSDFGWVYDAISRKDRQQTIVWSYFGLTSVVGLLFNMKVLKI